MKTDERTFYLSILKNGKVASQSRTKSMRRFLSRCRLVQFKDSTKTVGIKVSYAKKTEANGKASEFTNEGVYSNRKDLLFAATAFCNEK